MEKRKNRQLTNRELGDIIKMSRPGSAESTNAINLLMQRNREARAELVERLSDRILTAIPEENKTPDILNAISLLQTLAKREM